MSVLAVTQLASPSSVDAALSLADLDRAHETLMSCGEGDGPSNEPMWCADPSSPHCIPAAPQSPAPDLTDHSAPATLLTSPRSRLSFVTVSWPAPMKQHAPTLADRARLERPPRV